MRPRWRLVLLCLSLAVHLGVLGVYGRERHQLWQAQERYWRSALVSRSAMGEVDRLISEYSEEWRTIWKERRSALQELGRLAEQESPDPTRVEAVLDRLEQNDSRATWNGVRFTLCSDSLHKPEFLRGFRARTLAYLDSTLARRGKREER